MKKSFTLIELMISIVVVGILFAVLFRSYIFIANANIRIENEKNVSNEVMFLSNSLEDFSEIYNINYDNYDDLEDDDGLVEKLYLDDISVYKTGTNSKSWIQLEKNGEDIPLTNKNNVYIESLGFKILPYEDLDDGNLEYEDMYNYGFWVFIQAKNADYTKDNWPYSVNTKFQSFYNID
ncbi:type II secretion system protein [Candidatus Absconditicoccus praedator]|uniref:type II secretion system protein n=1 Tax=Candidatus Absconditicoccus praedator TaxID=2735562 RepID=UPI001E4AB75B|nr:type II secretion system protein [Candidatus Absconditicoccus praedator]UFX83323.1 type II secretion system protein [Candidatus Absconditicoccus praedator]